MDVTIMDFYREGKMPICSDCRRMIRDEDAKMRRAKILCEDCYIDDIMPKMPKAHYDNEAEFMNRLKDSYSVRAQQYH